MDKIICGIYAKYIPDDTCVILFYFAVNVVVCVVPVAELPR